MVQRLVLLGFLVLSACDQKKDRAQSDMRNLASATEAFTKAVGRAPKNLMEMSAPLCEREGCVLAGTAYDPWGTPYRGMLIGDRLRITSAGPDAEWDTADDLSSTGSEAK